MRILFLTSRIPSPPVGGDRFRVFHFLRTAAEAGHQIDLVTFDNGPSDPRSLESLRSLTHSLDVVHLPKFLSWWRSACALPTSFPLQAAYYRSARMRHAVTAAFDRVRPDTVYTHLFRMAPYALAEQRRHDARWILDLTDVISAGIARSLPYRRGPQRWLYREEGRRIERYESWVARRFDECWVISDAEAKAIRAIAPGAPARVVPNGIDAAPSPSVSTREGARLLYFGFQGVFHNRDAARFLVEDVLPRVRAAVPEATLDIAGKGSERHAAWARRPGVHIRGYLPDLERELRRAAVFVAPHRFAAGVQNKVVQALAAGTPVVTTTVVRQGLAPIPDDILCVGDSADDLAARIVELLADRSNAERRGNRGQAWVRGRFSWRHSLDAFQGSVVAPPLEAPEPARLAVVGA